MKIPTAEQILEHLKEFDAEIVKMQERLRSYVSQASPESLAEIERAGCDYKAFLACDTLERRIDFTLSYAEQMLALGAEKRE